MKLFLGFLAYFCALTLVQAEDWKPDEKLLDAICQVESSNGLFTCGDGGKSLGHFQMQQSAWLDVVRWRQKRNLETHDYFQNVMNPEISRIYASNYITILHDQLKHSYQREPSPGEIYAAYNMGLSGFRKCNYNLARVNRTTNSKCRLIASLSE